MRRTSTNEESLGTIVRRLIATPRNEVGLYRLTNVLTYDEPAAGVLALVGTVDGKPLRVKLNQIPRERFRLVNRGFHWINETPYQR